MNLKSILCLAVLLFSGRVAIQAQERYVSQADIDNFIDNFDEITNDVAVQEAMSSFNDLPTSENFVASIGKKEKFFFANVLPRFHV